MDKNFFLAIFLSVMVYVGWFSFVEKKYGPPVGSTHEKSLTAAKTRPAGSGNAAPSDVPSLSPASADAEPEIGGLDGAMTFHVGELELKIQPLGASVVSYVYPDPLGPVNLIDSPYPGFFATWPGLEFKRSGSDRNWPVFDAEHPSGVKIRKEYVFQSFDTINTIRLTLNNPGTKEARIEGLNVPVGPGMGTVATEQEENPSQWKASVLLPAEKEGKKDKFEEYDLGEETVAHETEWKWMGVHNRYFLAAIFPSADRFHRFEHGAMKKTAIGKSWLGQSKRVDVLAPWIRAQSPEIVVAPGETLVVEIPFYFGPKGYHRLEAIGQGLERSVSFGWFHRLGKFTLYVLNTFHKWTGNWGWSIILLTICLQVLMFPLTYKSTKSMVLMKKVAPEQAKLQQKFRNNPQRLNQEMIALYKKHNVNPLGGCLPMLAQMPIFIALFNMLRGAWELHGAPWIFWIVDLSAKDPYYVLPIVMGAMMYFQNKLNPTAGGDPTQQKMMQFLPVIMTFMFLNFPAGLVLYWLTNSILSFLQQILIKNKMGA